MITLKASKIEPTPLDEEIAHLFAQLRGESPDSDEYAKISDQLVKLYKLREETNLKKRVSPDTLAVIAGNLAGIVAILGYERAHIVTSKAFGLVMKLAR